MATGTEQIVLDFVHAAYGNAARPLRASELRISGVPTG